MIPSLHSFERVHPQVKLSMTHHLNSGRRRAEPTCRGIGIEVPVTDLTRPNSGKGDKQTKRQNVELSISSIGFRYENKISLYCIRYTTCLQCISGGSETQGDQQSQVI